MKGVPGPAPVNDFVSRRVGIVVLEIAGLASECQSGSGIGSVLPCLVPLVLGRVLSTEGPGSGRAGAEVPCQRQGMA